MDRQKKTIDKVEGAYEDEEGEGGAGTALHGKGVESVSDEYAAPATHCALSVLPVLVDHLHHQSPFVSLDIVLHQLFMFHCGLMPASSLNVTTIYVTIFSD